MMKAIFLPLSLTLALSACGTLRAPDAGRGSPETALQVRACINNERANFPDIETRARVCVDKYEHWGSYAKTCMAYLEARLSLPPGGLLGNIPAAKACATRKPWNGHDFHSLPASEKEKYAVQSKRTAENNLSILTWVQEACILDGKGTDYCYDNFSPLSPRVLGCMLYTREEARKLGTQTLATTLQLECYERRPSASVPVSVPPFHALPAVEQEKWMERYKKK